MNHSIYTLSLIALFSILSLKLDAQFEEKEALMSLGNQNALVMDIENVNQKKVESYFKSYFKKFGKVRFNKKADEFYIDDAKMKKVSDKKLNVYSKFQEMDNGVKMYFWADNGFAFIASEGELMDEFNAARDLLGEFDAFVQISLVEEELNEAEKNLASMEREMSKLEKEKEKYQKSIEDAQKRIEEMEKAIEENDQEQVSKTDELKIHKSAVEEIKQKLEALKKASKG